MIKVENIEVFNFEGAFRGLRNPMNSWDRSDSKFGILEDEWWFDEAAAFAYNYIQDDSDCEKRDEELHEKFEWLLDNGELSDGEHCTQYALIGPKDLKLAQTMIGAGSDERKFMRQIFVSMDITLPFYVWKEFDTYKVATVANSCSTMHKLCSKPITKEDFSFDEDFDNIIDICEQLRLKYLETKDKKYWRALIQILPSGYNQRRTITLNYEVLRNMYFARRNHKLSEWKEFCKIIEGLPYAKELICYEKENKQ